jgi:hypothetical protein
MLWKNAANIQPWYGLDKEHIKWQQIVRVSNFLKVHPPGYSRSITYLSCTPFSHKDTLEAYFDSIYMHNHLLQIVCRDQKFKVLNQTQQ